MARAPILQEVEAVPEADCLDGFAHPRATAALFGHEAAEAAFVDSFQSGRVHHGWLISGPEGIGKATLAYRMARFALARPHERGKGARPLDVATDSVAVRQVLALSHPGLLVIRRPWDPKLKRALTVISVDEVRRIKSFLAHAAGPDAWRVVIVDQADELNLSAANALLKSLEEPPARTLFLLVSSEPGRLLTTIRSRCRRLLLEELPAPLLRKAVDAALLAAEHEPIADKDWPAIAGAAQGSVRRALSLAQSEGGGLQTKVARAIASLPKLDWADVHSLADEVTGPGAEQRYQHAMRLVSDTLSRLVRLRALSAAETEPGRLAQRLITEASLAAWAELWETLEAKKAETAALNLDRKALILETFARMQALARGP